jgi:four helix bundle protein
VGRTNFAKLEAYQLAEKLADEVWKAVVGWDQFAKETVGKQIVRAADSVCANILEGLGRGSFADNRRFVRTARGSLNETTHFLRRAYHRNLLTKEQLNRLKPVIDELGPRLNAYLRSIGRALEE